MDYLGTAGDDSIDQVARGIASGVVIRGLAGNDTIVVASTIAIGGPGNDTLSATGQFAAIAYWDSPGPVTVDLQAGTAQDGFGTVDTLLAVHTVQGSGHGDTLLGSTANDLFTGGSGNDLIDGRGGVDTVAYFFSASSNFSISYNEATGEVTVRDSNPADGDEGTDTLRNIETLRFEGAGSDNVTIAVSSLQPSGFAVVQGAAIDNADAGLGGRWGVGDLNGDGRLDLVSQYNAESSFSTTATGTSPVRFLLAQPDGSYSWAPLATSADLAPTLVGGILLSDFNDDGKADVIVAASGQDPYIDGHGAGGPLPGEMSYVLMSGPGTNYGKVAVAGMPTLFAHHLSMGDVDRDGLPDVYIDSISGTAATASYFLINNGQGGFALDRSRLPLSISDPALQLIQTDGNGSPTVWNQNVFTSTALFDADGDGSIDLAVLPIGGATVGEVFLNDGSGHFSDARKLLLPAGPYGAGSLKIFSSSRIDIIGTIYLDSVAFDVNGDGRQDLVSVVTSDYQDATTYRYYQDAAIQVLVNTGSGFVDQSSTRTGFSHVTGLNFSHYDTIRAVDFNADGFTDLVLYRSEGNNDLAAATRILLNDGHGVFNEAAYPIGVPVGDFVAIDPSKGQYAVLHTARIGTDPLTGFGHYTESVAGVRFDWALGRDFFTGATVQNAANLQSDLPGRWIHGTNGDNAITLAGGNERAFGYGGNDSILGGAGDDAIDGGAGLDTAVYVGARANYVVSRTPEGCSVAAVAGTDGTDTLTGVERLKFNDATVAIDIDGTGGQGYRLYQAAFNRTPDAGGLGFWIKALDGGASLRDVAAGFVTSAEFQTVYGTNPTNAQLVGKYYENVLHRAPEAGGYNYWLGVLDQHLDTAAGVLANISESAENQAGVIGVIGNGFAYTPYG